MWKPEASSETGPTFGTTPAPTPAPRADGPPVHTNRWGTLPILLPFRLFHSFRCSHPPSPTAPCWPSAPRFQSNNGPPHLPLTAPAPRPSPSRREAPGSRSGETPTAWHRRPTGAPARKSGSPPWSPTRASATPPPHRRRGSRRTSAAGTGCSTSSLSYWYNDLRREIGLVRPPIS